MGLVQNLKRTLTNWGDKILVELSCLYIKQVAKQTSRKQDNSLSMESLPNHLTQVDLPTTIATSSAGTSEKIIMKKVETEDVVRHIRDWAVGVIEEKKISPEDQIAIMDEFYEWMSPEDGDLEIVSLEQITEEEYENFIEQD